MTEIWSPVPGWEGFYEVSSNGNVKSLSRKTKSRPILECILTPALINSGYHSVTLSKNNKSRRYLVHRLVALAFISNPNNNKYVNHKNGIKIDNSVSNLEWCSFSDNIQHSYDIGIRKISKKHIDRLIKFNKATKVIAIAQYTKEGTLVKKYKSGVEAAKMTGFDYSSIMACAKGTYRNHKTCGGFVWKYIN